MPAQAAMAAPATAATVSQGSAFTAAHQDAGTCSSTTKLATTEMTQIDNSKAQQLTRKIQKAAEKGQISVQAPQSALSYGQAKVYTVKADNSAFTSVTIPIAGEYSTVSNLTVLLGVGGRIIQYSETLISANEVGNFNITTFVDGALVNSNDTDMAYLTNAQLLASDAAGSEDMITAMGPRSTAACVASVLGVSGFVGYLIVGACTGACAVPGVGTAVCVACIGAYAAVGGASITAVASCFR